MAITYPPFELLVQCRRKNLLKVHRSIRSELSNVVLFLLSVLAVAILDYYFQDWQPPQLPLIEHFSVRWLSCIPALLLLEMIRKYHDDLYVFDLHRIRQLDGRLSLTLQTPSVRYSDIKAICISQDIVGRIFNYGNIELCTAGSECKELSLEGVVNPMALARLIDDFRQHSAKLYQVAHITVPEPPQGIQIAVGAEEELLPFSPS